MGALGPQAATLANVGSSATSVALFAAAGTVNGRTVYNDSTAVLYIAYGTTAASTTNYTVQVAAGGFFEFPAPVFAGAVQGIWAAANGFARVTSW